MLMTSKQGKTHDRIRKQTPSGGGKKSIMKVGIVPIVREVVKVDMKALPAPHVGGPVKSVKRATWMILIFLMNWR
jgi:hypothetical protein